MTAGTRAAGKTLPAEYLRIPPRQILVVSPTIRFRLGPGDRARVSCREMWLRR